MPFPPELQARIDAVRLKGGDPSTEIEKLRAKLAVRDGQPGFKANVEALRARIAILEADNA
jgi:hypothetical protein